MQFVKLAMLKIYTAEDVVYEDKPLYVAIIEEARRCKLAGGTIIKGSEGYGMAVRGYGRAMPTFFSGSADLPLIIEIVDLRENLHKLLPFLEKAGRKHFLATVQEVDTLVTDYVRGHAEQLKKIEAIRTDANTVKNIEVKTAGSSLETKKINKITITKDDIDHLDD